MNNAYSRLALHFVTEACSQTTPTAKPLVGADLRMTASKPHRHETHITSPLTFGQTFLSPCRGFSNSPQGPGDRP